MAVTKSDTSLRLEFFDYLFKADVGYLCISSQRPGKKDTFHDKFFEWPAEKSQMLDYIEKMIAGHNLWFGVNTLSLPRRIKDNCIPSNLVWSDLDTCTPDKIEIPPQCVVESSPGRFQAIWRLDQKIDPLMAEDYSKRIAYKYKEFGADTTGWDLTQLLRIPGTYNFKYEGLATVPEVKLITSFKALINPSVFEAIPPVYVEVEDDNHRPDMPDPNTLPKPDYIIYEYRDKLKTTSFPIYYGEEPVETEDWSGRLWAQHTICVEAGMTPEEVFTLGLHSKANKYKRDGRPISHLWKEVLKADLQQKQLQGLFEEHAPLHMPQLLTQKEADSTGNSIIHQYLEWAKEATDAVEEYHELACAILLSALVASGIRLHVEFGDIVPNLWGLILGDSTLTRKTTAMDMAMDILMEVDQDAIVASDGSVEGIILAVSKRPKMVSVFFRDEVAGLFESMQKKQYMAGMVETFTKMYDVPKTYPRLLSKDVVTLREPVFIFFGGGITERTYSLINEHYVIGGFLPRFLIVTGYTDVDRIRPTGPRRSIDIEKKEELLTLFKHLSNTYNSYVEVEAAGQSFELEREIEAVLTDEAWEKFHQVEKDLTTVARDSSFSMLAIPTFTRMAFSMLKLAMLLAAARQDPSDESTITVELQDILEATYFIQRWGKHTVELLKHAGQSPDEMKLNAIYRTIERHPGCQRSMLMQRHHLNKMQMDMIEGTLEDRMMITKKRTGKATNYFPIGR